MKHGVYADICGGSAGGASIVNSIVECRVDRTVQLYVSLNEKNETCHILVPNELKNTELLTVKLP